MIKKLVSNLWEGGSFKGGGIEYTDIREEWVIMEPERLNGKIKMEGRAKEGIWVEIINLKDFLKTHMKFYYLLPPYNMHNTYIAQSSQETVGSSA